MDDDGNDLLSRLRNGDRDAFAELVHRHHRDLLAVTRAMLEAGQAEEAVQDAWVAAWRALPDFEGRSSLRTWLTRIAVNEARMRLRRAGREVNFDPSPSEGTALAERFDHTGHWRPPPGHWKIDSPEALLEETDLRDCLEHTLAALPTNQRLAVELRDIQGHEIDAICNMLELSASNVRVLLHRARCRLFAMVEHYQETGEC